MKLLSDQERLRLEDSRAPQPDYFEYPEEGYEVVELYRDGRVALVQVNDYLRKTKIYTVTYAGYVQVATVSRKDADTAYRSALIAQELEDLTNVDCA